MCCRPESANGVLVIHHFDIILTGQDLSSRVTEQHQVGKGPTGQDPKFSISPNEA